MMSPDMKVVHEKMQEISPRSSKIFDAEKLVFVHHTDGSKLKFMFAYCCLWHWGAQDWLMVFTEHMGDHVFAVSDLEEFSYYKLRPAYYEYEEIPLSITYHPDSPAKQQATGD